MARTPRIIIAGQALHLVQRENNRQAVIFSEADYGTYLDVLKLAADQHGCAVPACVLMTNHVQLFIMPDVPERVSGMMPTIGRTYGRYINKCTSEAAPFGRDDSSQDRWTPNATCLFAVAA